MGPVISSSLDLRFNDSKRFYKGIKEYSLNHMRDPTIIYGMDLRFKVQF